MKIKAFYKFGVLVFAFVFAFLSCKKDKFVTDPSATVRFSQDSVLFDTVFTTIGSATKNIRVINNNKQKIKISTIQLTKGSSSQFIINVDGASGRTFNDIEIAANDSLYIFIQVNVNPTNVNSPAIVTDNIEFTVNGNLKKVKLEAWGQDAYYHYTKNALYFKDGSYLAYSTVDTLKSSYDKIGNDYVWKNDKPHVIYGYLVVDEGQKLVINAGTRVYFNYKAGLWVYRYGELRVYGQYGNEVIFQGARREADYADEPGQWDRIWINEGSTNNIIDYAIIKNGYIGVQAELLGDTLGVKNRLRLTNTRIQNMSMWGLYCLAYNVYAANNSINNCQEHSLNVLLGGNYNFIHCTFANYWDKQKSREKPAVYLNNHAGSQVLPLDTFNFINCIVDGKLGNEISFDLDYSNVNYPPKHKFTSCWIKTTNDMSDANHFSEIVKSSSSLTYESPGTYFFQPKPSESSVKGFTSSIATLNAQKFPLDLKGAARTSATVCAGAYQVN
ncbi:MAG TPA: hypothetical protein PLU73_04890 [Bacteroidia bacterium]|jgi:hypothetical protein|nr:hypothetical protein [Bacteroidia bacterium]